MENSDHNEIAKIIIQKLQPEIDLVVRMYIDSSMRLHLNELIKTAQDEAVKNIAAKLLKCALDAK